MSNADSKYTMSDRFVHYPEKVVNKVRKKYSFEFTIHGVAYRAWFDPNTNKTYFDCGTEKTEALVWLSENIDQLMLAINLNDRIDIVDLHKFVCKHLQANIEMLEEMKGAPISEQQHVNCIDMQTSVEEFLQQVNAKSTKKDN